MTAPGSSATVRRQPSCAARSTLRASGSPASAARSRVVLVWLELARRAACCSAVVRDDALVAHRRRGSCSRPASRCSRGSCSRTPCGCFPATLVTPGFAPALPVVAVLFTLDVHVAMAESTAAQATTSHQEETVLRFKTSETRSALGGSNASRSLGARGHSGRAPVRPSSPATRTRSEQAGSDTTYWMMPGISPQYNVNTTKNIQTGLRHRRSRRSTTHRSRPAPYVPKDAIAGGSRSRWTSQ